MAAADADEASVSRPETRIPVRISIYVYKELRKENYRETQRMYVKIVYRRSKRAGLQLEERRELYVPTQKALRFQRPVSSTGCKVKLSNTRNSLVADLQ